MPRWPKRKPREGIDEYGRNKLWYAAAGGDLGLVKEHLDAGVDPTSPDDVGYNSLHVATKNGHGYVFRYFLYYGADANAHDIHGNGPLWTAILSAPMDKRDEVIEILLSYGADPDHSNQYGKSPRNAAATTGFGLDKLVKSNE